MVGASHSPWYNDATGELHVGMEAPEGSGEPGSPWRQDEDVLDTWFSSALWPFSTLGWPDDTKDLQRYYPTTFSLPATILFTLWVARMIFHRLEFTEQIPFKDVLIHGLVRDSEGRKMSKSLGNGVDPIEVIERYGADAMRFMISTGSTPGQDLRFRWEKVEQARNFANKYGTRPDSRL
ncbi:class I tRNA ligase family protein [Cohnella faecalis]|uniref:class I tRNA ligase family protein n=1 Tax=Cohnella faecalis TaxID=2315694 RepID=UPI00398918A0